MQCDGQVGDVNADPAPAQLLRGSDSRATTTEGVEHKVARVAAGLNDPFEQGEGFLSRIAEAFWLGS